MNPKSVQLQYNINRMDAAGLVAIIHIDDYDTRFLEVQLYDRDGALDVSDSTATARFVTQDGYLLNDSVPCTISQNTVTVPIDAAAVQLQACTLKIEISLTKDSKVLTLPFPLFVRVRGSILDDAQVTPESEGTIPDLLKAAQQALDAATAAIEAASDYENMDNKPQINGVELVGDKSGTDLHLVNVVHAPYTDTAIDDCNENGVLYYASFADTHGFVICRNNYTQITQFGWTLDGRALWRTRQGETPWQPAGEWTEWAPTGGAGVTDYNDLENKPQINGITLSGNKSAFDLNLQERLRTANEYIAITQSPGFQMLQFYYQTFLRQRNIFNSDFTDGAGYAFVESFLTPAQFDQLYNNRKIPVKEPGIHFNFPRRGFAPNSTIVDNLYFIPQSGEFYYQYGEMVGIEGLRLWQKISGGSHIVSGVVNQNGTITFTDSDGNVVITSGEKLVTSGNQQISMGYDNGGFYFIFDDGQEVVNNGSN